MESPGELSEARVVAFCDSKYSAWESRFGSVLADAVRDGIMDAWLAGKLQTFAQLCAAEALCSMRQRRRASAAALRAGATAGESEAPGSDMGSDGASLGYPDWQRRVVGCCPEPGGVTTWAAIYLRAEGVSMDRIASLLGVTRKTVRERIARVKRSLEGGCE